MPAAKVLTARFSRRARNAPPPSFCGSLRRIVHRRPIGAIFRVVRSGWWRPAGVRLAAVAALGVVVLAVAELALHFRFSRAAPRVPEWRELKGRVTDLARDGRLIVVAPAWAEPLARQALGDELMPLAHVARPDATAFERALEVSILGSSHPEVSGWRELSRERHGRFLLRGLENPAPEPVLYDFVAALDARHARVALTGSGPDVPCRYRRARASNGDLHGHPTFPARRFACPGKRDWLFAGRTVIEDERYRPRQCIWAHPPGRGALSLRFDDVPIGRVLRGHAGSSWFVEREKRGTPVSLDVRVGGRELGAVEHRDGEGWARFELDTSALAGQRLPVEFRVSTRRARNRDFCFQADVR
jgi:hypothetical protein